MPARRKEVPLWPDFSSWQGPSDALWARLGPHSPWPRGELSRFGIQQDYANRVAGGQLFVDVLYNEEGRLPEERKQEIAISISGWLRQIPTYREYCTMNFRAINESKTARGERPIDIDPTLAVMVDSIPETQRLDEIVAELRTLPDNNLRNRNTLKRLWLLIAQARGITHSPESEEEMRSRVERKKVKEL